MGHNGHWFSRFFSETKNGVVIFLFTKKLSIKNTLSSNIFQLIAWFTNWLRVLKISIVKFRSTQIMVSRKNYTGTGIE